MDRPIDKHRPGRNHILKLWKEGQAVVGEEKELLLYFYLIKVKKASLLPREATLMTLAGK